MITEDDLKQAIAECEGVRNPSASTCIKLAAFYTIREYMYGSQQVEPGYSFASDPTESPQADVIQYDSGTEFSQAIGGRPVDEVLEVLDDLMSTLRIVNPRLYASVMRKFEGDTI